MSTSTDLTNEKSFIMDMFTPVNSSSSSGSAGKGSEQFENSDIILPRIQLLQGLSKVITEKKLPGATAGAWWITPLNRPLSNPDGAEGLPKMVRIVVAKISPSQRRWRKLIDGGGVICESITGNLIAREPNGRTGCKFELDMTKKKEVRGVIWEGGRPTDKCSECVFGPGANASALGRVPRNDSTDRSGQWLPKLVEHNGEMIKLPDEVRGPECTSGFDVLVYVLVPAFGELRADLMPALLTFAKTSSAAGKQLGSMIKLSPREPAWGKIYEIGSQVVTNDKGTFSVAQVRTLGFAPKPIQDMAEELYESAKTQVYSAPFDDGEEHPTTDQDPVRDEGSAPPPNETDKF